MLPDERKRVQRGQARRALSVFNAQLGSDASQELRSSLLHWQRAAQKEQVPGLDCFNIRAKRSWWTRQFYAKVFQPLFGTGVRCVRGHLRHHRPRCAPPSTCSTSPVTWLASVRKNTACAMSFALEICPSGDSVRRKSLGLFSCSGVSTTPGATTFTRMPCGAYSIARLRDIASIPPLVIIGKDAVTAASG